MLIARTGQAEDEASCSSAQYLPPATLPPHFPGYILEVILNSINKENNAAFSSENKLELNHKDSM